MSGRASTSRLSLEDWDNLTPLSPHESASVSKIASLAAEKVIPPRVGPSHRVPRITKLKARPDSPHLWTLKLATARLHQQLTSSRPATPSGSGILRKPASRIDLQALLGSPQQSNSSRPVSRAGASSALDGRSSAVPLGPAGALPEDLDPTEILEPIATTQQFHDWFARVEQSMERSQEEVYRNHLSELDEYIRSCETVLEELDDARGLLQEMEANYRFVEENSRALQLACETMLDEQKHLIEVTEAIGSRLEFFRELETATKMLNLPGEQLVLQDDFLNMIDRLDVCLEYLKMNRDFKDAEIYIIRFQQCLTRSMTLIKMYFVSIVRKTTSEVSEKMVGKDLSETALQALLFAKFSNLAPSLRLLVFELEKRARTEPNEYSSLLQECFAAWFAARSALLAAPLAEEVRRMDPGGTELVKLARAGCNHLRSVSMSEWTLYKEFFASGSNDAYRYLEGLCDYLYDSLRPRILHEPKLEVLCELCTVLTAMMALDSENTADDSDDEDGGEGDGDVSIVLSSPIPNQTFDLGGGGSGSRGKVSLGRLRFSVLLQTILQDTQTRLVFRSQAVIQNEVLSYAPTQDDLKYPEKLVELGSKEGLGLQLWTEDERLRESEVGGFRLPREEAMKGWYPTLRKTVWVLSKLNTYVNTAIFEDFAGEAVTLCRQSLTAASIQVAARSGSSKLDGQLFLIRHLLLLKEMIRSVDMVQIERAADFSTVTDALVNLLKNTSVIFNPNALFELASRGIPTFAETMTDAKTDLDSSLKRACEELISDSSARIANPIRSFLDKCTTYLSSPTGKDLSAQSWATAEAVIKLHDDFKATLVKQAGDIVDKLKVYLNDEKTIGVLLPPLLDEILDAYSTFYNLTRTEYNFSTSSSLDTPAKVKESLAQVSIDRAKRL